MSESRWSNAFGWKYAEGGIMLRDRVTRFPIVASNGDTIGMVKFCNRR